MIRTISNSLVAGWVDLDSYRLQLFILQKFYHLRHKICVPLIFIGFTLRSRAGDKLYRFIVHEQHNKKLYYESATYNY